MPDDGSERDTVWPLPKFAFAVEIPDVGTDLSFQDVSGLDAVPESIEYRHGDSPSFYPIKMPGLGRVHNVTLKNGRLPNTAAVWTWFGAIRTNQITPRTITIKLLDEQRKATTTWILANAWPTKIESMDVTSAGAEVALETLELAHEGITVSAAST